MIKRILIVLLMCLLSGFFLITLPAGIQAFGVMKKRPKLHEYGNVVINNFSEKENIAPVVFKHWLHRAKYTCRVCHVDIGFAMQTGQTGITEEYNMSGFYCGSCHNGIEAFGPYEEKDPETKNPNCDRCHSFGIDVQFKYNFYEFRKQFPLDRFGNGIDWLKSEDEGTVTLKDYIEGVSIRKFKIQDPKEFELTTREPDMPDITFSHQKHTIWNGCELCHPEIFGIKKDLVPYSMEEIFAGKYCGVCHGTVAFPSIDCHRCHTKAVI